MRIDQIKRKTKNRKKKYIGRGGRRGKTSGKGTKGQNSRAGRKKRPELRDIIKKLPKQRGYAFASFQKDAFPVKLSTLEKHFSDGDTVSPKTLQEKKIIKMTQGSLPIVKILASGELSKKLTLSGVKVSGSVREAVTKAGGSIK